MPRLTLSFSDVIEILSAAGFVTLRQGASSHVRYRGVVKGEVRFVDVAGHAASDSVNPNTLASIIRQSGLPKKLFREYRAGNKKKVLKKIADAYAS